MTQETKRPEKGNHAIQIHHGRSHLTIPFALAAAALMLVVLSPLEAKANCQDLIRSRVYLCKVKNESEDRFNECFRFTSRGEQSEDFDLFLDTLGGTMACDCQAGGGFSDPEFGEADTFHCVTPPSVGLGMAFGGKVKRNGRRINGEAVNDTGGSFIFRCDRVRDCEVPLSTLGGPSASW